MGALPPYLTHRLSAGDLRDGVMAVDFAARAEYAWDAGEAIGGYLEGMRAGRILGRHCSECGRVLLPPRMFCEECFRPTDAWVELAGTGHVVVFSVCTVAWDMAPLPEPEIPAVIAVDGGGPGAAMLHRLGGVSPRDVTVGMAVKAVWRPEAEREGSVLDLAYWAPWSP
jgi:uncharacterized OB-fold protein